jgi:NAD(P)-dependent dehydrogenase (short-subunit alcohol dehydrogenase family)
LARWSDEGRVAGKGALLVGGGGAIGAAVARLLAAEGARAAVADLDLGRAAAVADEIGGLALQVDVTDRRSVEALMAAAVSAFGSLSIVCMTAGLLIGKEIANLSEEEWERCLAVNLTGSFLVAKHALPALRQAGGGSILLMSSTSGITGSRGQAAYCAAKHGVVGLTRALADELAPEQIRVNCICPGWVDTPFNDSVWQHAGSRKEAERAILSTVPARRQASPEEIAPAALFLVSDEASYITGSIVVIDGGLTAVR